MLSCELSDNTMIISGDLRVQYLESLGDCLQRGLRSAEELRLDLRAVYEVDTAGLQAVFSFLLSRSQIGPIDIIGYSEPVTMALKITGLMDQFESIAT